jgi:hypothetical protein
MPEPSLPANSIIQVAKTAVRRIQSQLLLYGIVTIALIILLLIFSDKLPGAYSFLVYSLPVIILFIAVFHFALEYRDVDKKNPKVAVSIIDIFDNPDDPKFRAYIQEKVLNARRVVLIGTGLTIIQDDPFLNKLLTRKKKEGLPFEVYLADPFSPSIENRLIEEELGRYRPPIGRGGLVRRLKTIFRMCDDLDCPSNISVNLFSHYPTFSLIIVDQEYFMYPYGFATLGNFSPVMRYSKDNSAHKAVIDFFDEQYRLIKDCAVDAQKSFAFREQGPDKDDKWIGFALYIVPSLDSPLYRFGTRILGYDVRQEKMSPTQWQEQVGSAQGFGFHLTLCDALYFLNKIEWQRVCKEVEFLASEFRQFYIKDLQLRAGFPDDRSLSIELSEPEGSLEALHHELVQRIYRRANASNYTLDRTLMVRNYNDQRANLMLKRYKAPYILNKFMPHFTLLADVQQNEQETIYDELNELFNKEVAYRDLKVEKLQIMTRSNETNRWKILDEIKLL